MKKTISLLLAMLLLGLSFAGFTVSAQAIAINEWKQEGGYWYYYNDFGNMVTSGTAEWKGKLYLFDRKGRKVTKNGWSKQRTLQYDNINGTTWYRTDYYLLSDGVCRTGWQEIRGKRYYFDPEDGRMVDEVRIIDDKTYPIQKDGTLRTRKGWYKVKGEHDTPTRIYYIGEDGFCATGWRRIDKKWYAFYDNGSLCNEYSQNGAVRCRDADGKRVLQEGWYQKKDEYGDSTWYYLRRKGVCRLGWAAIDGQRYFFNPGTGEMQTGVRLINGKLYLFAENGALITRKGWAYQRGERYYITQEGVCHTGWLTRGKRQYYCSLRYGHRYANMMAVIDGEIYAFAENGVRAAQPGWFALKHEAEGKPEYTWLYLNKNGVAVRGWKRIDGKRYFFDEDCGLMVTSIIKYGRSLYVFSESGELLENQPGWYQRTIGTGRSKEIFYYYLDKKGRAKTGWQKIGSEWYYFNPFDGIMVTEATEIDGEVFYFRSDGSLIP